MTWSALLIGLFVLAASCSRVSQREDSSQVVVQPALPDTSERSADVHVGIAVQDTTGSWCGMFPPDSAGSLTVGRAVAIVFADSAGSVLSARLAARRREPCHAEVAQSRWYDYVAHDLESRPDSADTPIVGLAVVSPAAWVRGTDGVMRADVFGDGVPDDVRRCRADEGHHFTLWDVRRDGTRARGGHEYFDWGALVDPTCKAGEDGVDQS